METPTRTWSRWDVIPTGRKRLGEIKRLNKYSRNN